MKIESKELIDSLYSGGNHFIRNTISRLVPFVRRFIRFLALPYCMVYYVDWRECSKNKIDVFSDLLYIFFVNKRFPDNYARCRLWEQSREDWKYYYGSIYDAYQRGKLQKNVQRPEYRIIFDDKEVCYSFCQSLNVPLPEHCAIICPEHEYRPTISRLLAESAVELIIKPVSGCGGKGVARAYLEHGVVSVQRGGDHMALSQYVVDERSVVQRRLRQHQSLELFGSALPTIRVVTFLTTEGNVLVLGAYIRFGIGSSYVDNICSGGIYVSVDLQTGFLTGEGYDLKRNRYSHHPDNNIAFAGLEIPYWKESVHLAKTVQEGTGFYRLLGLDIGVTETGPVLVEINPSHDNNGLESACGPILKNKMLLTEFKKNDLLVHSHLEID
jgi:hypothetical protein